MTSWQVPESDARPGVPPPADEAGFRALLAGDVTSGGLWFPDPGCQSQFGRAGTIAPEAYDAFARCVATLHLRPTERKHWLSDASIVTDDAGFEIEAHVVDGKLDHIGFAGRAPGMPEVPTITPATLESLRVGGDPRDSITADEANVALPPGKPGWTFTEYVRVCLDETGAVRHALPGNTTGPRSAAAFNRVVRTWKFRPFTVAGTPIPACAITALQYPAPAAAPQRRLPKPPELSKAGNFVYLVPPGEMNGRRLRGTKLVVPDDEDKIRARKMGRLIGTFKLCVDETGKYERGILIGSTGLAGYDAKIARALMQWEYKPVIHEGKAVPVCVVVTFIYTQR